MSSAGPQPVGTVLAARLQSATTHLAELEQLVRSGDVDPRVLQDFRNAVDLIRGTAWAVQQWVGLKEEAGDPYSLLPVLAAQRVKRATQLARDLTVDLESVEIDYDTPGLKALFDAVNRLQERLMPLFQK
jgi:hypothetical protein